MPYDFGMRQPNLGDIVRMVSAPAVVGIPGGRMPRWGDAEYDMSALHYQNQREFTYDGRTTSYTVTAGPARFRGEPFPDHLLLTLTPDNYRPPGGFIGVIESNYFRDANWALASKVCREQGWHQDTVLSKLIPDMSFQVLVRVPTGAEPLPEISFEEMTAATRKQLFGALAETPVTATAAPGGEAGPL